ncbi:stage II sporulation protein D [Bacillus sp. DTU_2020_1000418_1_SI_GHA_SEK_038]|uniref:stage II sporulation protein D n=1 Tax=Bacillus sp. DTU_2020_1000418_1_SI_GHA_SEK_038 TaxID=3077585 RepID=UPI0028EA057D|nr:stage II sporulation protein D [Bacillus sp. DTU_2020_1000418_1_SI_GHA_SEK_038]WNS75255.1 stage II sporulation protein D [Bacillus sp. DTU_2020_1000418_1_SI_GHA_SEK_038]
MTKFKPFIVLGALLVFITLLIPSLLVLPFKDDRVTGKLGERLKQEDDTKPTAETSNEPAVEVAVFRMKTKQVDTLPLEDYVVGVVASEMPRAFEKEALKAQALAARTYIVNQMIRENKSELPGGALVTDTVEHQVYKDMDEIRKTFGADYKWAIEKITEAVKETSGQIIVYEGSPIDASFFSTSNGHTENSEAIWLNAVPYLKSVESPWDIKSPEFSDQKIFTISEFENRLGVKLPSDNTIGTITERTAGKRVGEVEINGKVLTGKVIREKLGLKSTDFTWKRQGNKIVIDTRGYGHGVGMSQYGANGMASEGKTYKDIISYYYKGVEITNSENYLTKVLARK